MYRAQRMTAAIGALALALLGVLVVAPAASAAPNDNTSWGTCYASSGDVCLWQNSYRGGYLDDEDMSNSDYSNWGYQSCIAAGHTFCNMNDSVSSYWNGDTGKGMYFFSNSYGSGHYIKESPGGYRQDLSLDYSNDGTQDMNDSISSDCWIYQQTYAPWCPTT